jgi:very-short-patch-repair endonuclease
MRDAGLLKNAKSMRKDMPEPALRLWLELRAARFRGIKFRREKVIDGFIADFAANDPKLVIEIDGDTHAMQEDYDARRTAFLEDQGYRVIRFTNSDVMSNMDGVLHRLGEVIDELRRPPLPTLSPEGERAK